MYGLVLFEVSVPWVEFGGFVYKLLEWLNFIRNSVIGWITWDYLNLLILRPALVITFVILFISVGWFLAWKLVLVHVPLIQEVFGLRKKPPRTRPPTRRLSKYYNSINSHNSKPSQSG